VHGVRYLSYTVVGVAQKLQKNNYFFVYCCLLLVQNVGYLRYSPYQLNNTFLAYFPTGNSLLKLEI